MDYTAFRENLRSLVESSGKTSAEIAPEIGMAVPSLSRYLNGARNPDIDYVFKIAQYFGVTVEWLFGYVPDTQKYISMSPQERDLIDRYNVATDDDRKIVDLVLNKYDKKLDGRTVNNGYTIMNQEARND